MNDVPAKIRIQDRLFWVVVIVLAALVAFMLLRRDAQKQFGAVSFGSFPKFKFTTSAGKNFDDHEMKGQVWVVHFADDSANSAFVMSRLGVVALRTWTDKRHLYLLTLKQKGGRDYAPLLSSHYIASGGLEEFGVLKKAFGADEISRFFLVDQNGIIRGIYMANNPDNMRQFGEDVLRLL